MGWKLKTTHRITRGNSSNQNMNIYYEARTAMDKIQDKILHTSISLVAERCMTDSKTRP